MAIIQTAYANGASTKYITDVLKCKVLCQPTGVKYLHQAALNFDIAIYFEANGHGTIHYKKQVYDLIQDQELKLFFRLSNQAVGDAFSNVLLAEMALQKLNMTVHQWLHLYNDYPSLTTKVQVAHKELVQTNYEENELQAP